VVFGVDRGACGNSLHCGKNQEIFLDLSCAENQEADLRPEEYGEQDRVVLPANLDSQGLVF
jgi:hypothetical protein